MVEGTGPALSPAEPGAMVVAKSTPNKATMKKVQPGSNAKAKAEGAADERGTQGRLMLGTLEKSLRVLSAFDKHQPNLGLLKIAAAANIDVSSAQRIVHTLTQLGYLDKNKDTKQYSVTVKCLSIGLHFLSTNSLIDKANPYLVHLSQETDETINLTMLDDVDVVIVARVLSRHILNTSAVIGTRMPAFCTAPGIAILSKLPEADAAKILDRSDLRAYTRRTVTDRRQIMAKIRKAARDGYATAFEEFMQNDASIAAAIVDAEGMPQGAVNIAAPYATLKDADTVRFSALVTRAAAAMSG